MLKSALVEAGWVATRTKNHNFLKHKYESLVVRRGKKRALVAVGHKILCAAYFILRDGEPYKDVDVSSVQEERRQKQIIRYKAKLQALGVAV